MWEDSRTKEVRLGTPEAQEPQPSSSPSKPPCLTAALVQRLRTLGSRLPRALHRCRVPLPRLCRILCLILLQECLIHGQGLC